MREQVTKKSEFSQIFFIDYNWFINGCIVSNAHGYNNV